MNTFHTFFRASAAAFCVTALAAQAATWTIDLTTGGNRPAARSVSTDPGLLRRGVLPGAPAPVPPLAPGDTVTLLLFDGTRLALRLDEAMPAPLSEGRVFTASLVDGPAAGARTAVVIADRDGLTATATGIPGGNVVRVFRTEEGTVVEERDPTAEPVTEAGPIVPPAETARHPSKVTSRGDQSDQLVDVLVAYDKGAQSWVAQNGGMTNFAETAVQRMNAALANTKLDEVFRFRLVGVMGVDDTQTEIDSALDAVRGGQGAWAAVHDKRDAVGADVVTALIDNGSAYGTTGQGFSLQATTASGAANFSEYAYNACLVRSVAISDTMTHETGHNLGCGHSNTQTGGGAGPQSFSYSSGYHFTGSDGVRYHTIMAYYTDGTYDDYTAIPYFSSPDFTWAGVPAGTATANDNTRVLRQTAAWAGNWRERKIPLSYDVFFSPAGGAVFSGTLTVTLTPGRAGLPIRYTLDGTAPTLSSPLYTGPITLTQTTTIRAAAVTDGILGPAFTATYSLSDLGGALDAPQLTWTTNPDCPWIFVNDDTWDGTDAAQSTDDNTYSSSAAWLSTTVDGPATMSFRYKIRTYTGTFSVLVDGTARFEDSRDVYNDSWHLASVNIPEGTHTVKFLFEQGGRYTGFNGAWLDGISFDAPSRPPTLSPATTTDLETALAFSRTLAVTLVPPEGATGTTYYTLDGTAPSTENGLVCSSPILLTATTWLRAIFVEDGKGSSPEVSGIYRESHPVEPGEWTTDAGAVQAAAARDGRLIAVLLANRAGCWWSQQFYPVAEDPAFLAWAKANGIYLVTADSSCNFGTDDAEDWFWSLCHTYTGSYSAAYPQMYFVRPDDPDTPIDQGLARNDGESTVGTALYLDTVDSLVAGFASVLGETVPLPPTASPAGPLVEAFPIQVALSHPNTAGAIYYTLDGSSPTPSGGTAYTGPVTIPDSATVLRAAVWPPSTATSGLSSPVFVGTYKTIADILGTEGVSWTTSGTGSWREDASSPATLRAGGLMDNAFQATLQATVGGKGKLVFTYAFNTWSWQNSFAFSVNGQQQWKHAYDGTISFSGTVTNEVTDTGNTTFAWTLSIADPTRDYGPGYTSESGAWLSSVSWIPEGGGEDAWTWEAGQDGGAVVTGGPEEGPLAIPETLGGLPVTGIGEYAFYASGTTSVSFPDTLSRIGRCAFGCCDGLVSVEIGENVSSIGEFAFESCGNLLGISVAEGNPNYSSRDGVLFSGDGTLLICCPAGKAGGYAIPGGVEEIGWYAFRSCSSLASVELPDGLATIGGYAFDGCSGLASLVVPDSVESIGPGAFSGCTGLALLELPAWWEGSPMLEVADVPGGCEVVYRGGVPLRPANDDYADAKDLGKTVSGTADGDNIGATWEVGEPKLYGGSYSTNSVWWTWTAPATGVARFDTVGSQFDTVLAVFTNATPAGIATLKAVKSDGGSAGNGASRVWFGTTAKRQYWIAVAGSGAQDAGQIALNWQQCVKVTFKGNGATSGSMGARTNVYKKATALPACKFKRTGYTCDGWATSAAGTVAYALDAKPAFTKNTTLYAHWKLTEQLVTFDANGGTCGTAEQTYVVGEPYGELPTPKRSGGHVFLGWWTEQEGGEQVTDNSVVEAMASLTLWAHWTDRQVTTFLANGGKPASQATTNTIYADYGAFPEAKWSGHALVGWFTAPEGGKRVYTNSTVTLAATRTLYAQWTTEQVTTFKANGGSPAIQKTTNTIYADYGAFPSVKWSRHALVGWFTAPEGGKRIYTNSPVTLAATRTLYAQWTTNQVTTFKGNGGTPEIQKMTNAIYTHYGTLPEAAWENHLFLGWFNHPTKGKRVYTNTTVTLAATRSLYAHWTDKQVVTFKGNGGSPATAKTTNTMGTAYGPLPTPKKSGYALLGWFTKAEGGDEVTAADLVTPATTRTLYAHWTDQQVTTFLGNGGTPATQVTTNTIYAKYAFPPTPAWAGHTFQGWYSAQEGGKQVNTNTTVTLSAARTLYAHWTTSRGFAITAIAVGADAGDEGASPRAIHETEKAENACRLRCELSAGTEYEIQWTASLSGEWEPVERLTAETDGELELEIEVPGFEKGFFRLVATEPAVKAD